MTFWLTIGRSLLAVALGVALFLWPEKSSPLLGNFIGGFWIASGILSVQWGLAEGNRKKLTVTVGVIGVLAGLITVGRRLASTWVREDIFFFMLGVIAVLTGLLHISGGLSIQRSRPGQRLRAGMALGVFEVILGVILILSPREREGPIVYTIAIIWAFLGAVLLFGDAILMRRESKSAAIQSAR